MSTFTQPTARFGFRFVTTGAGGADPARGSGLVGLKDRVEETGGAIVVESPIGAGTSLFVELPLDDGQPRNAAAPSS